MRALEADLLLLGGDYAETSANMRFFLEEICAFEAPLGKFAVQGNNDAQCAQRENLDLPAMMARSGVQLLVNERAEVRLPGGRILIGGVDECYFGHPDGRGLFQDARENDARILLSHYPVRARDGFSAREKRKLYFAGTRMADSSICWGSRPIPSATSPKRAPWNTLRAGEAMCWCRRALAVANGLCASARGRKSTGFIWRKFRAFEA